MTAQDWDTLVVGCQAFTYNGKYEQKVTVTGVDRDHRGMRWVTYRWTAPNGERKFGHKRYISVYLEALSA